MQRQINHKTMRVIVGLVALSIAPLSCTLSDRGEVLTSISISYWTDARDIFVSSLVAVGFFLFSYNGVGKGRDLEFYLSKIACFAVVGVALFPTGDFNPNEPDAVSGWIKALTDTFHVTPEQVHYVCAATFFLCLMALIGFFSVRAMKKNKRVRAYLYRGVGVFMILGIVVIALVGKYTEWQDWLFWLEFWGLSCFGVGWLLAGSYKTERDKDPVCE